MLVLCKEATKEQLISDYDSSVMIILEQPDIPTLRSGQA